jgi:prolyl-tRNA synthetase
MTQETKHAISPTRSQDYSEWYQEVVKGADLAEHSPVRGCMVIKPWGYGIWENIQRILNAKIKETGHQNAYFPLFIPLSFMEKEAQHVEGFAKECAVVTHSRLEKNSEGKLAAASPLDEPLIVRPTSEMIIGEMFSKWVQSWRDLPLLINQWANIVRWEMRTRLFLRTTEFLWQEGHTVHATEKEAEEETRKMLDVYADFCHEILSIPVIRGEKTQSERFPGAVRTYAIEAMMQDRKSLQAGTSHFLGQNFAKSCQIRFTDEKGDLQYGWTTSWGVTTRLIGGIVMTHSDDDGLVLPPRIAPSQIVLLPILHKEETKEDLLCYCRKIQEDLKKIFYHGSFLDVILDESDKRGGEKKWGWIKKGIPLRLEIGPRERNSDSLCVARRDQLDKPSLQMKREVFLQEVTKILDEMQKNLFDKAKKFQQEHTRSILSKEELVRFFTPKNEEKPEIHGGYALAHFCQDPQLEEQLKKELNITVRCIPLDEEEKGRCILTGKMSPRRVIFAKAY